MALRSAARWAQGGHKGNSIRQSASHQPSPAPNERADEGESEEAGNTRIESDFQCESLGRLGDHAASSGALLGTFFSFGDHFWSLRGSFLELWGVIFGPLGRLGSSFRRLGSKNLAGLNRVAPCLSPKWSKCLQKGSQNGAKMVKNSIKNSIEFWMCFLIAFSSHCSPFLMPKWSQIGTKVEAQRDINTKTPTSAKCYETQ